MAPPVLAFGRSTGLPLALQTLQRLYTCIGHYVTEDARYYITPVVGIRSTFLFVSELSRFCDPVS